MRKNEQKKSRIIRYAHEFGCRKKGCFSVSNMFCKNGFCARAQEIAVVKCANENVQARGFARLVCDWCKLVYFGRKNEVTKMHKKSTLDTSKVLCGDDQCSFAPAGMCGSSIKRFSRSSPFSLWRAERSMPQDSRPIMGRGGRLVIATQVLPMSCSGS